MREEPENLAPGGLQMALTELPGIVDSALELVHEHGYYNPWTTEEWREWVDQARAALDCLSQALDGGHLRRIK